MDKVRTRGKIIQLNPAKGYGFITSQDVPFEKIFFHWEWLNQTTKRFPELVTGDRVSFELVKKENSYQAYHIQVESNDRDDDVVSAINEANVERIK